MVKIGYVVKNNIMTTPQMYKLSNKYGSIGPDNSELKQVVIVNDLAINNNIGAKNIFIAESTEEIELIKYEFIELNKLQNSLSQIVFEQADLVNNIESNIAHTRNNVNKGTQSILGAEAEQGKCSICGCSLDVFFIIVIISSGIVMIGTIVLYLLYK